MVRQELTTVLDTVVAAVVTDLPGSDMDRLLDQAAANAQRAWAVLLMDRATGTESVSRHG